MSGSFQSWSIIIIVEVHDRWLLVSDVKRLAARVLQRWSSFRVGILVMLLHFISILCQRVCLGPLQTDTKHLLQKRLIPLSFRLQGILIPLPLLRPDRIDWRDRRLTSSLQILIIKKRKTLVSIKVILLPVVSLIFLHLFFSFYVIL